MNEAQKLAVVFRFDDSKSLEENCEGFLSAISAEDPEMAAILRSNWNLLATIVRGGERDSKARSAFNVSVASALDDLIEKSMAHKEGQ